MNWRLPLNYTAKGNLLLGYFLLNVYGLSGSKVKRMGKREIGRLEHFCYNDTVISKRLMVIF